MKRTPQVLDVKCPHCNHVMYMEASVLHSIALAHCPKCNNLYKNRFGDCDDGESTYARIKPDLSRVHEWHQLFS